MSDNADTQLKSTDITTIRGHVESLFDAYLAGDRDTLRRGRLPDWKGFQIRSTRLIRCVDDYMDELEKVLGSLAVERYEFLDFQVDVIDDVALAYYIARDWLHTPTADAARETAATVLIRALDVYRRVDGRWIQAGSNICAIADPQGPR